MSKIIKKQDITVLIENTLKSIGVEKTKKNNTVIESKEESKKDAIVESKNDKPLLNEGLVEEMNRFKKLTSFNYKY